MNFIVAGTFERSLARFSAPEQKMAKLAAFDLQMNPKKPGFKLERVDQAKDPNFWSARVNDDIRIIVHRSEDHFALCYTGHHADAYRWAERHNYEVHPATGAAQFVEINERTVEVVHRTIKEEQVEPPIFRNFGEDYLFSLGVPRVWMDAVMAATNIDVLDVLLHLPSEAAERLLDLASGNPVPRPSAPQSLPEGAPAIDPFMHPDAQHRFRIVNSEEQLSQSLNKVWSRNSLVPSQPPYSREAWLSVFPHGMRRLLNASELAQIA